MKKVIFAIVIASGVMLSSCGGPTTKCEVTETDTTIIDSVLVDTVLVDTVDSTVTQTVDTVKTK
jgi:hypothetical protein